jgi:hypothetical protein
VGDVYRQAVLLWLAAAGQWRDAGVDWLERVCQLYQQNDEFQLHVSWDRMCSCKKGDKIQVRPDQATRLKDFGVV